MILKPSFNARVVTAGLVLSIAACPDLAIGEQSKPTASEFDKYRQQMQQEFSQSKDEFKEYKRQLLAAFETYKRKTSSVWGARDNVMPDSSNWVSYQGDLNHRGVVDFENGTVDVEVALPAGGKVSDDGARRKLEDTIVKVLKQGADTRPMAEVAKQPVSMPKGPPVLRGQVADENGNEISQDDYDRLAARLAQQANKKVIRGGDGKSRLVYETRLHLVPDHIRKRAEKFQSAVERQAARQEIKPALIFAVIETESFFNPYARSPAPAFGLMQLVPTSGARDAYRYVYNKDKVVSDTYLYNPDNNIELGAAYLNRLYYRDFKDIKSSETRKWATIAGYNTGPGNVFRSFAGKYSRARFGSYDNWKKTALREINRRTPEQVYQFMRSNLPYTETRAYIAKVRGRIDKYGKA
jgi:membrane-bound lytic murein transglycosylase C